jgi:hypothetical protein
MITVTKKPPVIALCDNTMLFELTTDLASGTDGVFILVEPWYSATGQVLGSEVLYPPVPGAADTNLSEYLRSGMFALKQFVFPEQGNIPWNAYAGLIKEYKLKIQECYTDGDGDPVVTTSWLENRYVVRGKIPKWKWASFYGQYANFLEWISTAKAFLTFAPNTQRTAVEQVQKLYLPVWWETQSGEKLNLKVDVAFTDGTTGTFTTVQETAELQRYTIIEFGVGYTLLNLANWANTNHPGKTIYSYSVSAMAGSTTRSETRTYIVERNPRIGERQFIFANSVGGYDTLLAVGRSETNSEYMYDVVSQQSPGVQALSEKKQLFVNDTDVHTCRTGYFDAQTAEYLAEFFLSTERYEISGSNLIPLVLRNAKVLRKRDSENEYFAEFDYEHAFNAKVEVG